MMVVVFIHNICTYQICTHRGPTSGCIVRANEPTKSNWPPLMECCTALLRPTTYVHSALDLAVDELLSTTDNQYGFRQGQ